MSILFNGSLFFSPAGGSKEAIDSETVAWSPLGYEGIQHTSRVAQ